MATLDAVIRSDPAILGGTPVFRGTRVPVKSLVDYLAAGDTLDQFLDDFPTVKREQAVAVPLTALLDGLPSEDVGQPTNGSVEKRQRIQHSEEYRKAAAQP